MSNPHPITPPPELRCQWQSESPFKVISVEREDYMIDRAAQWGADQELEACCEWLEWWDDFTAACQLRTARRPNPPSLKEQALALVEQHEEGWRPSPKDWDTIRRALEALPND